MRITIKTLMVKERRKEERHCLMLIIVVREKPLDLLIYIFFRLNIFETVGTALIVYQYVRSESQCGTRM